MSDRSTLPAPIDALVRAVGDGASPETDERASTFARGLAIGALVGAAIAGSAIWQRRHATSSSNSPGTPNMPADGSDPPAA